MKNWDARDYALMTIVVCISLTTVPLVTVMGIEQMSVLGFIVRSATCFSVQALGYCLVCKQAAARIAKEKNAKRPE